MQERTMVDTHGVEVFSRWWMIDDPQGVVIISHGASEHSGRYDRFARALNDVGLAAVAIDHRGHGRTGTSTGVGIMGPGGGMAVVEDLHQLRGAAEEAVGPAVPVYLFGHSLGCLIALVYLTHHSEGLAGAVLCGMPSKVDDIAAMAPLFESFAAMRDQPASDLLAAYNAAFEPGRTPYDWLSRDEDEVDKYIADPLCGDGNPLTYGYLIDLYEVAAPAGDRLASVACPALVIAGERDAAAEMGAHARTLAAALGQAGVATTLTVYPGARHELLNETNRDEVTAAIIGWIEAH